MTHSRRPINPLSHGALLALLLSMVALLAQHLAFGVRAALLQDDAVYPRERL
jgi:hypothetical protein